jgi:hypothetical protein
MTTHSRILFLAASLVVPSLSGCALPEDGDANCDNGRCDDIPDSEVPDSPCDGVITDKSGANHQKVAGRNGDPFAKLVMMPGDSCPTSFSAIMDKLRETDAEVAPVTPGISTLISETAQATGSPTSYRAVTTRKCGSRTPTASSSRCSAFAAR